VLDYQELYHDAFAGAMGKFSILHWTRRMKALQANFAMNPNCQIDCRNVYATFSRAVQKRFPKTRAASVSHRALVHGLAQLGCGPLPPRPRETLAEWLATLEERAAPAAEVQPPLAPQGAHLENDEAWPS